MNEISEKSNILKYEIDLKAKTGNAYFYEVNFIFLQNILGAKKRAKNEADADN